MAVFGETAERLCQALHKGDRVYVEGTLRLSEWTGRDGEKRTGLSVAAWKAEKLGVIGRNKPPKRRARGSATEPEAQPEMEASSTISSRSPHWTIAYRSD